MMLAVMIRTLDTATAILPYQDLPLQFGLLMTPVILGPSLQSYLSPTSKHKETWHNLVR